MPYDNRNNRPQWQGRRDFRPNQNATAARPPFRQSAEADENHIPITADYAAAVGEWCEAVENRSLLHEKFAFPKRWLGGEKQDKASSWSLMRIASNGAPLLRAAAQNLRKKANGQNVETQEKRARLKKEADLCEKLANTTVGSGLDALRAKHTARFLDLLRAAYPENHLAVVHARLEGRLAINLAEGVIQNAGISLDRIFGLPLIPGSAIKGIARHAAWLELQEKKDDETLKRIVRIFGAGESDWTKAKKADQSDGDLAAFADIDKKAGFGNKRLGIPLEQKGAVSFLQASPTNDAKIVVDITNVHTPDYYQYEGIKEKIAQERDMQKKRKLEREADEALGQKEHPTPNTFPAVERGAEFAFPIVLNGPDPDPALLEAARHWLTLALTQNGLGAKTAAGYGWFSDLDAERRAKKEAEDAAAAKAEQERLDKEKSEQAAAAAFAALSPEEKINSHKAEFAKLDDQTFAEKVKAIASLSEDEQRGLIRLFSDQTPDGKAKRDKLKTWRKKKPDNVKPLEAAAAKLNEKLP
jgi:CRISPR type III-B/RAMP module RAMP protein Cmr6